MENLTQRAKDFSIYTPSIQLHSAERIVNSHVMRDGILPNNLTPNDFNFLDETNKFWYYKWALATAGHFKNSKRENIITNRDARSLIIGDSSGYQIGTGALDEFKKWRIDKKNITQVMNKWRNEFELKKQIVDWLDCNCDYAMTIDIPLWIIGKEQKSPFVNCSKQNLIDLSVENLKFLQAHRGEFGNCKYLSVLQGDSEQDEEDWFNAIKSYKFEGWSLAGNVGSNGGIYRVLRRILRLRDAKLLDKGFDWIHVLRLSKVRWSPLLTAIQRALRIGTNEGLTISYDSSSPYRMAGVKVNYAFLNSFGRNLDNDWTFKTFKFPTGYGYANITKRMPLSKIHNGHLHAPLYSPIAQLLSIQDLNYKKGVMDIRNIDAFADEVIINHNVYVYCMATIMANETIFNNSPSAPQRMMDAVGIIGDLFKVDDWKSMLDNKRAFLESVVGS